MIRKFLFLVVPSLIFCQEFPTDICALPKEIGKCRKYVQKYFYNSTDKSCQTFGWGGCDGNANRYDTKAECESYCIKTTPAKQLRAAPKSSVKAANEVFTGTLFDVSQVDTDIMDFESGLGNWNATNMRTVNLSDLTNVPKPSKGEMVLLPTDDLSGNSKSELLKSFNIEADSNLEIDFSLFVSGYNNSLVGKLIDYNPSFSLHLDDESSSDNATVLDLARLNVPNNVWTTRRWKIRNEKQKTLRIVFMMAQGQGENNTIALDDVTVRWIPMLETEVNTVHKNFLFSNTSAVGQNEQVNSIKYELGNNQSETTNSSSSSTTTTTEATTTTTTQSLFEMVSTEIVNNTDVKTLNGTTTKAPVDIGSEKNVTHLSNNVTEATVGPSTTSHTDNPNIFGPFNTTEPKKNESSITTSTTEPKKNESSITTESSNNNSTKSTTKDSSNIIFPDSVKNTTESTTTESTKEETNQTVSKDQEATKTTKQEEVTEGTTGTTYAVSNSSAIKYEDPDNEGTKYGYTAEVVLICLVVIFGLLFLLMVVKYYRLRTSIGDYQIQQGARQTYDNPAFNGFGMQDSYRSR